VGIHIECATLHLVTDRAGLSRMWKKREALEGPGSWAASSDAADDDDGSTRARSAGSTAITSRLHTSSDTGSPVNHMAFETRGVRSPYHERGERPGGLDTRPFPPSLEP
jgi:hypothetical protein